MGSVRNVVLMNVYLDLENHGGSGFRVRGVYEPGEGNRGAVYEQPRNELDGYCHIKEGSK